MLNKALIFFAVFVILLSSYAGVGQEALATHTDIFIPVLLMDPKSPLAGQQVTITIVVTNKGIADVSEVQISFGLDGKWIIDNVHVDVPAQKSIRASIKASISAPPGQHQLKACPERHSLGDDGHQCQTLDFVIISESTIVVTILSPKDEEVLHGNATIRVAALGQTAQKVELYVQQRLVDTKYQMPFDFTIDTTKFENGQYRIYAIAYFESGLSKPSAVKKYFIDNGGSVIVTVLPGHVQEAQAKAGQSVIIESDIRNGQSFKIAATFIVLVKDSNGFTEFLSWKEDKISINETLPMSLSWIPEAKGRYAVEVFLWDTIDNAVPLTDVMKANIVIS